MKAKYTKKQIKESIEHWQKILEDMNKNEVPVISSIKDFLDICKEKNIEVKKDKVSKQGKIVNATIADEDKEIKSREGKEIAKKGDLIVDDGDDTFYAVNSNDIAKYYELDQDGNSITGDNTKWKKIGKELEYYITPFDVDVKVQWQDKPLHASKGYSLVCNDKEGKDISPVAPEVFNDKTLWIKNVNENIKTKYTKKQIAEAIKHWQIVLESMQLNESVFDRATLLRDFNINISYLDKALAEQTKHDLEMFKSMIEELPDTSVDSYEGKKVPLENQLAYSIVGFLKSLVLCDATTRKSLSEADSGNATNGVNVSTDVAKNDVCAKVYSVIEDIVGKLDDAWLESSESTIKQGGSFTINATRNNSGKWYGGFHSSSREEPDETAQVDDYEIEPYDGTYMDEDDIKKLNDIGLEPEWQDENEIAYEVSSEEYNEKHEYIGSNSRFSFSYDLAYKFNVIDIQKFTAFVNTRSI